MLLFPFVAPKTQDILDIFVVLRVYVYRPFAYTDIKVHKNHDLCVDELGKKLTQPITTSSSHHSLSMSQNQCMSERMSVERSVSCTPGWDGRAKSQQIGTKNAKFYRFLNTPNMFTIKRVVIALKCVKLNFVGSARSIA